MEAAPTAAGNPNIRYYPQEEEQVAPTAAAGKGKGIGKGKGKGKGRGRGNQGNRFKDKGPKPDLIVNTL